MSKSTKKTIGDTRNNLGHMYENFVIENLKNSGYKVIIPINRNTPGYDCEIEFDNGKIKVEIKTKISDNVNYIMLFKKFGNRSKYQQQPKNFSVPKYNASSGNYEFDYLLLYNTVNCKYYLYHYNDVYFKTKLKINVNHLVKDIKTMFDNCVINELEENDEKN